MFNISKCLKAAYMTSKSKDISYLLKDVFLQLFNCVTANQTRQQRDPGLIMVGILNLYSFERHITVLFDVSPMCG